MENKIINYINQTPENTNPSVLATLLGELKVPKPLTYDYMPEGYPSKSVGTVTLMEEQELTFADIGGVFGATLPVQFDISGGEKLTVVWDGLSYDAVVTMIRGQYPAFGNLGLLEAGDMTDCPFAYLDQRKGTPIWAAADTAASHTIKVMRQQETITPMSADFMPIIPSDKMPTVPYLLVNSSTTNSTKVFKLTVDDSGAISTTEVTL